MISLEQYLMGRDIKYPPSIEWLKNADTLLSRVNALMSKIGIISFVTSGYRPGSYNKNAGGATLSAHLTCRAIDLMDRDGEIKAAVMSDPMLLDQFDLWMEHPDHCNGWVHFDTKERKNRVFRIK